MIMAVNRGINLPAMTTVINLFESSSHPTADLCGAISNPCGMSDNGKHSRHFFVAD